MLVRVIQNSYDLEHEFSRMGRRTQFSPAGYGALFDLLESYAEDMENPLVLDVIGVCCQYTEYTQEELESDYGLNFEDLQEHGIPHELGTYADETAFAIVDVEAIDHHISSSRRWNNK